MQHGERVAAVEGGGRNVLTGAGFASALRETGVIRPGQAVLVAISGGIDSMVLLHLLRSLAESWELRLRAAHFDHRIRPESAADAAWVAGVCRAWEVPLEEGSAVRRLAGQAAARSARYHFLDEAAARCRADRIATAHHADDQAETVLFRAIRGAGLHGLAGIPPRRGRIVRPLLEFWRAEIEGYARREGVPYREDPSNLSPTYARNRIRHEILPRLEEIVPGAARSLAGLAEEARADREAWREVAAALEDMAVARRSERDVELARGALLSYHPRVRALLLRRILHGLGVHPGRGATGAAVEFLESAASGNRLDLAAGVRIEREFDRFRISRVVGDEGDQGEERPLLIAGPESGAGEAVLGGDRHLTIRWMWGGAGEPATTAAFDPAAVRFPLEIRSWRPGDRIRMSYGTKQLKKLFAEHRVGRAERPRIPVLAEVGGASSG
jgi:tRNA(Ile)-lysidine synthase